MSLGTTSSNQVATGGNTYVNSLLNAGWRWTDNTVLVSFENSGFTYEQSETISAALLAFGAVANLNFEQVSGTNAEEYVEIVFHLTNGNAIGGFGGYSGTPNQALQNNTTENVNGDTVLLGDLGRVHTYIASDGTSGPGSPIFDASGNITSGGFELTMHEIGHALGLKHPHDNGSSNHPWVFPGVTASNDTGDGGLNQQIYTIMSYNEPSFGGGESATPMAFDIAAIQQLYGARTSVNAGNNDYYLPDPNNATTWSCLWDTGGTDQILYLGLEDVVIDLRPATLDNSFSGGGLASYSRVGDTFGRGYTIAGDATDAIADQNGVTGVIIENARGGGGDDRLIGNDVANVLNANDGADFMAGLGGDDTVIGGNGADTMFGGEGRDTADYTYFGVFDIPVSVYLNNQSLNGGGAAGDVLYDVENLLGTRVADILFGDEYVNVFRGYGGNDRLAGGGGVDVLLGGGGGDVYTVDAAGEAVEGANGGVDTVRATVSYALGANVEKLVLLGAGGNINGLGNALNNSLAGNGGANGLDGHRGSDVLTGGAGADRFRFTTALNGATNVDFVTDFQVDVDEIRLDNAIFAALPLGALAAGAFRIGAAAADVNDRIIYNSANGNLFYDRDGAGGAAQVRFARLDAGLELDAGEFVVF